jgi:hypothetical protein
LLLLLSDGNILTPSAMETRPQAAAAAEMFA